MTTLFTLIFYCTFICLFGFIGWNCSTFLWPVVNQLGFISWDVFLNAIYTSCYQLHTLWWIINIPSLLLVSGFPHFFGQISLCPTLVSYIIELYFGAILTFLLSYCGRVFTTLVKVHTFQELALNDSEEGKFVIVLHISHLCIWVRITCGGKVMYLTS